jgi:hypothetical protein
VFCKLVEKAEEEEEEEEEEEKKKKKKAVERIQYSDHWDDLFDDYFTGCLSTVCF